MTDKMPKNHKDLVSSLSKDLKPVKCCPSISVCCLKWLIPTVLFVGFILIKMGIREHIGEDFQHYSFSIVSILLLVGAALACWFSVRASIPGQEPKRITRIILLLLPILFIGIVLFEFFSKHSFAEFTQGFVGGEPCMIATIGIAIVPAVVLGFIISRLAPLKPYMSAYYATLAALMISGFAVQLHCQNSNACHLTVWHYLPIIVGTLVFVWPLSYFVSKLFLNKP